MKHRKGSVARAIQDYLLKKPYLDLTEEKAEWCWFEIPNNPEFCVALEWQGGYDPEDDYGVFSDGKGYVINISIKMTDEFRVNGDYALYAEYYYTEEDEEIYGGYSLSPDCVENQFYDISKWLADEFNKYNRMTPLRD